MGGPHSAITENFSEKIIVHKYGMPMQSPAQWGPNPQIKKFLAHHATNPITPKKYKTLTDLTHSVIIK